MSGTATANRAPPQAPPRPATAPVAAAPLRQRRAPNDVTTQWAADYFRLRGWRSNAAKNAALKGELDTAAATLLAPGGKDSAAALAAEKLEPGTEFKTYLKTLAAFEQSRDEKDAAALKKAAAAYVAHYDKHSSSQKTQPKALRKRGACQQSLTDLDLLSKIGGLGDPPWSSVTAMQAATTKAEMDFRSLPIGEQTAEGLGGEAGVNTAFWVNKASGDPAKPDKTYLFKPASTKVDRAGVPEGGEPAREALTGRAAEVLNGMTGIDFRVPDTQIVTVDRRRFEGVALKDNVVGHDNDDPLVGSLQQFAASKGELRQNSPSLGRAVSPERCQELAILDVVTMHVDRHSGNFMLDGDDRSPDLVPIDNGLSFPETPDALTYMATPHNALLRLPGSHKPFTPAMLAKIGKINPNALKATLKKESDDIGAVHDAAKGKVGEPALEQSRRAAMFLKLAAPTLTPAAVQVALGQNAAVLFDLPLDDRAFVAKARDIIQSISQEQGELAEFLTMTPSEQGKVRAECDRLGWNNSDLSPTQMLKVFKSGTQCPGAQDQPANPAAATPGEMAELQLAFPTVKVSDKWAATHIKNWRNLAVFGDGKAVKTAIQAAAAKMNNPEAGAQIVGHPGRALAVLRLQAAADALPPPGPAGNTKLFDMKRDLVKALAQILEDPTRTELSKHADRLRAANRIDALDGLRDMATGAAQRDLLKEIEKAMQRAAGLADTNQGGQALQALNLAKNFILKEADVIQAKQDFDRCKANFPIG